MSKLNGKWINYDTENLTHSGDDLAVKFSDADAPDVNKVWSSAMIDTISGTLNDKISVGTSGTSGTSGVSGTSGSSGTSGIDGTSGSSGTSGVSGTSGSSGSSGTSGVAGTSGSSGTSGIDGTSGSSGSSGSSGTSGVAGTSGSSGTSGNSGTSGSSGSSGTSGGIPEVEYFTLDGDDITNKYVILANTPYAVTEVAMDIIGGCAQIYGIDYTVSGTQLGWNGLSLDGVVAAADKMRTFYTYTV